MTKDFTGCKLAYIFNGQLLVIESIVFGSEGQFWQLMEIEEFLANPLAVAILKNRLLGFLKS